MCSRHRCHASNKAIAHTLNSAVPISLIVLEVQCAVLLYGDFVSHDAAEVCTNLENGIGKLAHSMQGSDVHLNPVEQPSGTFGRLSF